MNEIDKTNAQWQEQLTPEQFQVCRECGTEPAFSGEYYDCHEPGIYRCICCGLALFDADSKYDSGSGWPSFTQPIAAENIALDDDASHGMARIEVSCERCGAHLGHVFSDGPKPTGLRYCINSTSLALDRN